ncbi:hypothetical protein B0H14DRAFT_3608530 [Mycena olivaceomarginata]|nr:hypothetical protein B0H14DRAFT_3608530 [Mycena olivaceomarginata]
MAAPKHMQTLGSGSRQHSAAAKLALCSGSRGIFSGTMPYAAALLQLSAALTNGNTAAITSAAVFLCLQHSILDMRHYVAALWLARTLRQYSLAGTRGLANTSFAHLANVPPNLHRTLSKDFNLNLNEFDEPQTFNMLLDISPADVMVAGKSCIVGCLTDINYDTNKSSTAMNISTGPATITFGFGGSSQGYTFTDTMMLGRYYISNAAFHAYTIPY